MGILYFSIMAHWMKTVCMTKCYLLSTTAAVSWNVLLCSLVDPYQHFTHMLPRSSAASKSKMLISVCQITLCHVPEYNNLSFVMLCYVMFCSHGDGCKEYLLYFWKSCCVIWFGFRRNMLHTSKYKPSKIHARSKQE
jgi:hypothetical protein